MARHGLQQDRRVLDRARDRPRLIERGGEGDDAPARAAAVSRLDADRAGDRGRLADRAAGVGRGRAHAEPRRHRRRRAARRAARHELGVRALAPPGIDHRAVKARLVGRAHGELVIVELAEHHRAGGPEICRHRRLIGRREAVEDVRAGGGADALGAEQILDAERNAFERPRLPCLSRASLSSAISSARSGVLRTNAFSASFAASIASRCARASSSRRERLACARPRAPRRW